MSRMFVACRQKVHNRGRAPVQFLNDLVDWARDAPAEIFDKNATFDIYSSIRQQLGPWQSESHRRAAMLELLRVLAGFESSWDWEEGIDITNTSSNTPCTEEAGIFQCSGNSMAHSPSLKAFFLSVGGDGSCASFRALTKSNHVFAIEYCARLLRFTTKHHGPVKFGHVHPWLSRDAVMEFQSFLL
jgi:hypothetical protein